ncbi:MAG: hypothetical protein LAN71_17865 [Acidobacteriia bacterium]|nr:hypothetical protein [Terriglobia bacterium]
MHSFPLSSWAQGPYPRGGGRGYCKHPIPKKASRILSRPCDFSQFVDKITFCGIFPFTSLTELYKGLIFGKIMSTHHTFSREELFEMANRMTNGEIESLRKLRKTVVDLDLTQLSPKIEDTLFGAIFFSKKITGDIWANLFTDASFEFDEQKLKEFTISFGETLKVMLSDGVDNKSLSFQLGNLACRLYKYFYECSINPGHLTEGGIV